MRALLKLKARYLQRFHFEGLHVLHVELSIPGNVDDGMNSMLRACRMIRLKDKGKTDLKRLWRALHKVPHKAGAG